MSERSAEVHEALGLFIKAVIQEALREAPRVSPPEPPQFLEAALLTVAAAAVVASVSKGTICNWMKAGKLTRYGHGRLVRVRKDEVLTLMKQPKRSAALTPEERAAKILGRGR